MMRAAPLAAVLVLAAAVVAAQTPMAPEEYEALAEGRTLHYSHQGQPFGSEQYFPGRRSLWRFATGECAEGTWHADGRNICFDYEGDGETLCWSFQRSGERIRAVLLPGPTSPDPDFALDLTHLDDDPLVCPGPDLGM